MYSVLAVGLRIGLGLQYHSHIILCLCCVITVIECGHFLGQESVSNDLY